MFGCIVAAAAAVLRCVTVRLHETDIDTLVATGYLSAEARQDAKAIKDAAQTFVWDKLYECAHGWRRPNEKTRQRDGWAAPLGPGAPGAHHQGGTRMGSNPQESVVNKYSQSWNIPNLFIMGSSTHPTMSGFNPTLTIQALAYMTADAVVNHYRKNPGPLI